MSRRFRTRSCLLFLAAAALALLAGCQSSPTAAPDVGALNAASAAVAGPAADVPRAMAAQDRHGARILALPGIVGIATGRAEDGAAAILVLAERPGAVAGVPRQLDGVQVVIRVTGPIRAVAPPPGKGKGDSTDPKGRFARPVPIGVSTGNEIECSAGTVAARVRSGGTVYALSNNHVYAAENDAPIGSRVLQPGRYDTACAIDPADVIGTLADFEPIVFSTSASNTIDAAIAVTSAADLGTSTPDGGYGMPSSSPAGAEIGLAVQKYGRTTRLTRGSISAIHGTVNIGYGSGTARFVDQIFVESRKAFIRSGDSGSLMVTQGGNQPVGLLYAANSSGTFSIANRIDLVLARFGVSIDGN